MPVLGLPVKQRKDMSCALLSNKSLVCRVRRLSLVRQITAIQVVGCSGMEQREQTYMGESMARLIEKENVEEYLGWIVYLETLFGGDGLVAIIEFSYRPDTDGSEALHTVEIVGFDEHDEYEMDDYGITWRLWEVCVESPSAQQMAVEPWEVY